VTDAVGVGHAGPAPETETVTVTATREATAPRIVGRAPALAPVTSARTIAREQVLVTGGQLVAGVGNLLFALVMARVLDRREFTELATFLVCYLLLHLPGASFGAASALVPRVAHAVRRRALIIAGAAAVVLVALSPTVASALHQPLAVPLLLAAATPTAALLALERGRLYGTGNLPPLVGSLVAEPAGRLTVGLALAFAFGATGAALGVVLAGYGALAVARRARGGTGEGVVRDLRPHAAVVAFFLLALLQNEDLLLAARLLPAGEAARFAALSTLGGVAAFATATVPLVLLPRVAVDRKAMRVALAVTVAVGGSAVLALVVAGPALVSLAFGPAYSSIQPLAAPYVLAMALLGVVRVVVADATVRSSAKTIVAMLAGAVVLHVTSILVLGRTADAVMVATLVTMGAVTACTATATVVRLPRVVEWRSRIALAGRLPALVPIAGITAGALVVRLLVTRGIWVDEAISVSQAKLPFGVMLERLQIADVHPPLHASLLWGTIRLFGTGELSIRAPSILAGTLVVPMLFVTGRELFDRRTGLVAAAFGAVFPLAIWYSQEARMYALYMLFAIVAIFAQARALRQGQARYWALYGVATAALLWTQYLAVLVVIAQQIVFVAAFVRRRRAREPVGRAVVGWVASLALAALLLVPLLPYLASQLGAYTQRGAGLGAVPAQAGNAVSQQVGLSVYSMIANLVWAVGGYHADDTMEQLAALWPLAMVGALALLGRRRSTATGTLWVLAGVPLVALFAIGLRRPDLFEVRYVAGVVPVLTLLAARATTALAAGRRATRVVAGVLVVVLLGALADQQLNGANPRLYDFRGAVREVSAQAGPGDHVLYNPVYLEAVVHYYGPELHLVPVGDWRAVADSRGRVFVIGSFFDKRDISARTGAVLAKLERTRRLVATFRRPQIRVWVFE
jgi:O-antigen/teichoic acid export membrane protein